MRLGRRLRAAAIVAYTIAVAQGASAQRMERIVAPTTWHPVIVDRTATVSIDPTRTTRTNGEWDVWVEYRHWQDKPLTPTVGYATAVYHQRIDCHRFASRDLGVQLYTRSGRPIAVRTALTIRTAMTVDPPDTFQGAFVRDFCHDAPRSP